MAKIICPNKQYTGVSASVSFVNGIGETNNQRLIAWFKMRGYSVEDSPAGDAPDNLDEMTTKQLKAFADENGIDVSGFGKKPDILEAIQAALDDRVSTEKDDTEENDTGKA